MFHTNVLAHFNAIATLTSASLEALEGCRLNDNLNMNKVTPD